MTFTNNLSSQRLPAHIELLKSKFWFIEDGESERLKKNLSLKMHDLYDWLSDSWVECKTDKSNFTNRLLIEYKANVPLSLIGDLPERQEIPYADIAPLLSSLPSRYDALATDKQNLEQSHYLSYLYAKNGAHFVYDIRELRAEISSKVQCLKFFICGEWQESWRTIAVIVPLSEVQPIKLI
jgi:hypothetical protein